VTAAPVAVQVDREDAKQATIELLTLLADCPANRVGLGCPSTWDATVNLVKGKQRPLDDRIGATLAERLTCMSNPRPARLRAALRWALADYYVVNGQGWDTAMDVAYDGDQAVVTWVQIGGQTVTIEDGPNAGVRAVQAADVQAAYAFRLAPTVDGWIVIDIQHARP
jgi:hypothetical protein